LVSRLSGAGSLCDKDYGAFLRLSKQTGLMLLVQNPFLDVVRDGQSVSLAYAPEMQWNKEWGKFVTDTACIGPYRQTGQRFPREMVTEWHLPPASTPDDGMDRAEVAAFTDCVQKFLVYRAQEPNSVEVGWTLNDYQIDVGTEAGREEYKRIIDTASSLGVKTLLYAPENSKLSERTESADTWSWEYVLWLNLGEKIRRGEWDPAKDPVPADVSSMIAYAKQKHVGLLAYVYPSVPFAKNPSWIVKTPGGDAHFSYASLGSRELQDYLIHNLVEFEKRTGIAGYSFDYTWLNLPGSSSYSQWYGWRRVMEALRRADPTIVIDGRQSYQQYGPWSWLAGSYPHPTGNDEQPESFKPYPDLHFDRVSADRTRFVNYWYRNYQFAPAEIIPGYATHQTERSMGVASDSSGAPHAETETMMYTRYLPRDWDYLGFRYSFISSIATGGWNNVVDMIPGRDTEEWKHFSSGDKDWIRNWLNWTTEHKDLLRHTRTILQQPAMGHVDGTSAIEGDHGYLFLFNSNYKQLTAEFHLDETIGIDRGGKFFLREIFPQKGRVVGKPGVGLWERGDAVRLPLDGTSATVLEVVAATESAVPILLNASVASSGSSAKPRVTITGRTLSVVHAAGEAGTDTEIAVLLPHATHIAEMIVNGQAVEMKQTGRYVGAQVHFREMRFPQAAEIPLTADSNGSLKGSFAVPQRVFDQLALRAMAWPIPWTEKDYETTWLAPERLLMFVQIADASDALQVTATLDGTALPLTRAYSSTRVHSPSFVGFYTDVSRITPEVGHELSLKLPALSKEQFQGVFFDNVEPYYTEALAP
jgi:hypothetical protein